MARQHLSLHQHLRRLQDPRINRRKRHLLGDILTIAICAVVAGANTWPDIESVGQKRREWLQRFLDLPNGIPSHDTFERVFDRLDPAAFQACFQRWIEALAHHLQLRHIAIDGKTLRGSGNGPKGWKALHLAPNDFPGLSCE